MAEFEFLTNERNLLDINEIIEDWPTEQIKRQLNETIRANEILELETQMFENWLLMMEPASNKNGAILSNRDKNSSSSQSSLSDYVGSMGFISRKSKIRSMSAGEGICHKLEGEEKCSIVTREIDHWTRQKQIYDQNNQIIIDNLIAVLEESDIQLIDLQKELNDWQNILTVNKVNTSNGNLNKNKKSKKELIYILQNKIDHVCKERDEMIVKYRLKNESLKNMEKKLIAQLKQKEESGGNLAEIDFSKLRVENVQLQSSIHQLNKTAFALKTKFAKANKGLNLCKQSLEVLEQESASLEHDINQRQQLTKNVSQEIECVVKEKDSSERLNTNLKEQFSNYEVPTVIDFISHKVNNQQINNDINTWKRKINVLELKVNKEKKILHHSNLKFMNQSSPQGRRIISP